jgi:hypothetical protein
MSCPTLLQEAGSRNLSARLYWRKALGESSNSTTVKMVANSIANHTFADGTGAHPSRQQVATEATVSVRTVTRAITTLVANGWLMVVWGGGRRHGVRRGSTFRGLANSYELVLHRGEECEHETGPGYNATDDGNAPEYRDTDDEYRDTDDRYRDTDDTNTGTPVSHQVKDLFRFTYSGFPILAAPRSNGDATVEGRETQETETQNRAEGKSVFSSPAGVVKEPPTDEELAAEIERRRREAREAKRLLEQAFPDGVWEEADQ